jgi:hypothetical protein
MTIEQLTCSPTSGLIEFPGFGDALVPEEVSALDYGHPRQVDRDLWAEFFEDADSFKNIPRCWRSLPDIITQWLSADNPTGDDDMKVEAFRAMEQFVVHYVPVHIAYVLLPTAPGNPDWLKGQGRQGKITVDQIATSLAWITEGIPDADVRIYTITCLIIRFPLKAQEELGRLYRECAPTTLPKVFRHLYQKVPDAYADLEDTFNNKIGSYKELSFPMVIPPLPKNKEEGADERPGKRRKLDQDKGLITFK